VTDRPILFSGPMVRALLDGRKTQTRRIIKPGVGQKWLSPALLQSAPSAEFVKGGAQFEHPKGGPLTWVTCPYGVPGDRLWVREAWATPNDHAIIYRANWQDDAKARGFDNIPLDDSGIRWKPSIHMTRSASRLWLEITDVRVERLQAISETDAAAEGLTKIGMEWGVPGPHWRECYSPVTAYLELWDRINGAGAAKSNPWVWAVSFDVRRGNLASAA
jgi:hypothetical protein